MTWRRHKRGIKGRVIYRAGHLSRNGYPLNTTALGDGSVTTASVLGSVGVDVAAGRVGYRLAKNSTLFNLTSYALSVLGSATTRAGLDGFDFLTPIVSFTTHPKGFYRVVRE